MNYWLMKSEPTTFSIDDLAKLPKQTHYWDGVRNYQARNMMKNEMKKGDLAFFYHSSCSPAGIVGIVEVVKEAYPDFTAFDSTSPYFDVKSTKENPRWYMVEVKLRKTFNQMVTLSQLRETPNLQSMRILQKGNRLSITPLSHLEWSTILSIAKEKI